ncbi:MAG: motility protein A [Phycisphaerae bacterium]
MELGTILGYLIAWGSLIFGMWHITHGDVGGFMKPMEVLLVGGLALGATVAGMPFHATLGAFGSLKKMLFNKPAHVEKTITEIVEYAETARRDGVLALETVAKTAKDPFLKRGLQLTIDGTDPEVIERIMRVEIEAMIERHKHGKHFWHSLAKFGPGCGLIACLVGQIAMFKNLNGDAATIGAALSVALVGTLYGALIQNVIAGPIAEKLGLFSKEEVFEKEIIMAGVLSIQAGNNPRVVEMQLLSFIAASKQAGLMKAA